MCELLKVCDVSTACKYHGRQERKWISNNRWLDVWILRGGNLILLTYKGVACEWGEGESNTFISFCGSEFSNKCYILRSTYGHWYSRFSLRQAYSIGYIEQVYTDTFTNFITKIYQSMIFLRLLLLSEMKHKNIIVEHVNNVTVR